MKKGAAIVTGGGRGIGRAIVDRFLEDGLQVVTCGRGERPAGLEDRVVWLSADVSNPRDADRIVAEARDHCGKVDILVNNAGVQLEKTVAETTDADWDLVMGVNARGTFNMCRAVLAGMREEGGVIVNIGSISGVVSDPSMAVYNGSKAFVHALTRSIAIDHGPKVRSNAVGLAGSPPGWSTTPSLSRAILLPPRRTRWHVMQRAVWASRKTSPTSWPGSSPIRRRSSRANALPATVD